MPSGSIQWQSGVGLSLLALVACCRPALSAEPEFRVSLNPFLQQFCHDCHADGANERGLDLATLGDDLGDEATFARWERLFDRVRTGEMPPADAQQPDREHRGRFIAALERPLNAVHRAAKGTVYRRLNRREYENTLNDLFGTQLDLQSLLPEDGRAQEFDNVGAALNISMVHMQLYLDAIDAVMDAAIAQRTEPPASTVKQANYAETREGETHIGKSWKQLEDGAVVFFRGGGYPSGMLRTANVREAGRYRIKVTAYAYQSADPITFAIGATTFQQGAEKPTFAYRSAAPNQPTTVEVEAWIDERYMVDLTPWGIDDDGAIRRDGVDQYEGPGLAVLNVELTGPLVDEFPSRGHRLIFDGMARREVPPRNPRDRQKSWYVAKFEIQSDDPRGDAARSLLRIARAAFRRPVSAGEIDRYVDLFESQRRVGASVEDALRTAVAAIFCSTDFLYLHEPAGVLNDHALAARLAYFLTRTTPDAALLAAAEQGRLASDPAVLSQHTQRLLDDPRSQRFIADFCDAWLNLRDIEFTSPDRNLYPEFDQFLQHSMLAETRSFLAELITKNLSVRHLVKSDFAMLNQRLAVHYGIDGVHQPEVQRTRLAADSVRGGLLSQGSILKVSANGTNTSPVVRGVWVLERIMGISPPPPPPGIPGVEPDIRGASTLRELLAKHRDVDSCRNCHQLIDPPGFALESFNPIGGWRDRFRSLGEGERVDRDANGRRVRYRIGPPVDSSGTLTDGTSFAGYQQYRDHLAADEDRLARTLATKLFTFATGREMGFSDRTEIDQIVARSRGDGHGVRGLIELVVASEIFRSK